MVEKKRNASRVVIILWLRKTGPGEQQAATGGLAGLVDINQFG